MTLETSGISSGISSAQGGALSGVKGFGPMDMQHAVGSSADAQRFAQALAAYKDQQANPASAVSPGADTKSIGSRLVAGLSEIAGHLKSDHKAVSSMIEKATIGGDDAMMMKAMLALADYQQRVQIVSKTVSKAASSLDQLTRLQ